ncbi:MAG: tRNA (5-methylaminomethyl-2-thiouridine)(34)-methyltransferase MnmD [Curvibacter sp.]
MDPTLSWLPDGRPYSPRYDDIYRSQGGALAQARVVFLGGCGLPMGWEDRASCRILETGFGLGLNFLASWAAWQADARHSQELHFVSIEAHPVGAADLLRGARALQATDAQDLALLPRVQMLVEELARAWAGLRPGLQHWDWEAGRVRLSLGVGEVQHLLPRLARELPGPADAVYLDGFSPARNPAMWSTEVIEGVARLCRPGTRLASWCVAGEVRARLQRAGFELRKAPGLPPKRHRLEARYLSDGSAGA